MLIGNVETPDRELEDESKPIHLIHVLNSQESTESREDRVRILAYLKWLDSTGGKTLDDDPEGVRFWLQAESEVES